VTIGLRRPVRTLIILSALALASACGSGGGTPSQQAATQATPEATSLPASSTPITGVTFDWSTHRQLAPGSDNWPATWSDDGNQYAMWGDGGGFGGTNTDGRASLGVARIEGDNTNYQGVNRFGGKNGECPSTIIGKVHGAPLSLHGILYAWLEPDVGYYDSFSLIKSTDKGCTWTQPGVMFTRATDGVSYGSFINFGQDNGSAIDGNVYFVAPVVTDTSSLDIVQRPGKVMLLRAPAASIEDRNAYEFYAGADSGGQPTWSSSSAQAVPIYQDPDGVGPWPQVIFVPGLNRFVYTNQHGNGKDATGVQSLLTMAEAPAPWGPWKDFYRDVFFPQIEQSLFQWNFAPKWLRSGGTGFTLIFTGTGSNDSWNTVDGSFTTASSQ
jgi:hypothetical protein